MTFNILVVEDEDNLREFIGLYFKAEGDNVIEANNGKDALEKFNKNKIDLIILDIMMPIMNGYEVCKSIRSRSDVPIIILTAVNNDESELKCYELGADDYMTKPLKGKTLVAKAKRMLERCNKEMDVFIFKTLRVEISNRILKIDDIMIDLAPKEYDLLAYMIKNINIALSRETILTAVWGYSFYGQTRVVDNHIRKLRKKLGIYSEIIQTVTKIGYRLQLNKS